MGSFPQVSLLEPFEGAVLSSVPARNHGEVGGELQHVVCETLLLDSRTSFRAQLAKSEVVKLKILGTLSKKKRHYLGIFPNMGGGVFPNPKTFVNLPSIFLYAKFILRC